MNDVICLTESEIKDLIYNINRVLRKFATDDNGVMKDWTEWQELKESKDNLKEKLKMNNFVQC